MRKNKKEKTKSNTKLTNNPISLPESNSERDDNFYLLEENNPNPNSNNFKLKYKHTGEFNNIVDNNSKLINNETKNNKSLNSKSKNKLKKIIPKDKKKPEKNSTTFLYPKPKSVKNKNKNRKKKTKSINKTTKAKEEIVDTSKMTKYVVKNGDTAEKIIKNHYGVYSEEKAQMVMKANNLSSLDRINIDQELLLP